MRCPLQTKLMYKVAHANQVFFVEVIIQTDVFKRKTLTCKANVYLCLPFAVRCTYANAHIRNSNAIIKLCIERFICRVHHATIHQDAACWLYNQLRLFFLSKGSCTSYQATGCYKYNSFHRDVYVSICYKLGFYVETLNVRSGHKKLSRKLSC